MIRNSNIYREALEIVNQINRMNFEYGGKTPQNNINKMGANLIVNFGIELCEKQKEKKDNICDTKLKL